jgi:spore coat polysaccharide biosynthesis protein SpsF
MPKIVAIVQARMSSSRLPGKVLRNLSGKPMLEWVVSRLQRAQMLDEIIVATTTDPTDEPIVKWCQGNQILCARGSLHDVLDRFFHAARQRGADVIVRVTADCPLVDPVLVDETIRAFNGLDSAPGPFDFAANRLPPPFQRTYPIGLDTEVCTFTALERAWREAAQPFHREHVMPYFYEGIGTPQRFEKLHGPGFLDVFDSPRGFRTLLLNYEQNYGELRWTVDTPADLAVLEGITAKLLGRMDFNWQDVLTIVQQEPELMKLNAGTYHKDFRESEQGPAWNT